MVKLVGAVCILGAGTWAWRRSAAERRRELDTLADLTACWTAWGRRSGSAGPACPGCWGPWAGTGRDLSGLCTSWRRRWRGAPLGQSWRLGRGGSCPSVQRAGPPWTALGDSLQGDEESVCKA